MNSFNGNGFSFGSKPDPKEWVSQDPNGPDWGSRIDNRKRFHRALLPKKGAVYCQSDEGNGLGS